MTVSQLSLRGRIGAYAMHARNDSRAVTAPARAAFMARFLDEVDPDRTLPEGERLRRATMARKSYFAALAYRSAVSRAKRSATSDQEVTLQEVESNDHSRPPSPSV